MSIVICEDCKHQIDSDDDPDCFVEIGNMRRMTFTIALCESCRDRQQEDEDAMQEWADRACAAAEQRME